MRRSTSSWLQFTASAAVLMSAPLRAPLGFRLRSQVWPLSVAQEGKRRMGLQDILQRKLTARQENRRPIDSQGAQIESLITK